MSDTLIIQIIGLYEQDQINFANYLSKKYGINLFFANQFTEKDLQETIDKYSSFILKNKTFIIVGSIFNFIKAGFYKRDYLIWLDKKDENKINNKNKMNKFNEVFREYEISNSKKIIIDSNLNLRDQEKIFLNIMEKKDYEYIQGKDK
ncbi:hypothetical protein [Spiroplasma sp. BIUS-1]|uniref:hypothetical protein n=1 Tax=Spiroplasma sp. BIUS-1 TaxID=216964 RepID=UPI001397DD0B|nr:hypothetical protein [Spiroplasma sp. BIUS-1]QHX36635.1 hypothetical protein SBIUS_v1c03820 [Spiroplasma sp. BIUS-1]